MRDHSAWSLNFGRWRGVYVRLHASFLVVALGTFFFATRGGDRAVVGASLIGLIVLLASVVLHELAHLLATMRMGGHADLIVLGPLGGWSNGEVPREPQCELTVALAGPAANLVVCAVCVPLLLFAEGADLADLLHPLRPRGIELGPMDGPGMRQIGLRLTFWINWVLVLVNLLPGQPLDGGRALRSVLWPALGYRTARIVASRVAKATALVLGLLAWATASSLTGDLFPAWSWAPLILLAMLLFFSAREESIAARWDDGDEGPFGYDFSQGYTSLQWSGDEAAAADDDEDIGAVQQWLAQRREAREHLRRQQEQAEEARVDLILARLHKSGIDQLSPDDRQLLERVSARYRSRLKS